MGEVCGFCRGAGLGHEWCGFDWCGCVCGDRGQSLIDPETGRVVVRAEGGG